MVHIVMSGVELKQMYPNRSGKITSEIVESLGQFYLSINVDGRQVLVAQPDTYYTTKKIFGAVQPFTAMPFSGGYETVWHKFLLERGVTAKALVNIANKMVWSKLLVHYEQYKWLYRSGKTGRVSNRFFSYVVKAHDLLEQAKADKQENIMPLIMFFNKSPAELKVMFGKGVWKSLCANSRTRNLLIIRATVGREGNGLSHEANVTYLNKFPSSVLPETEPEIVMYLKRETNFPYTKFRNVIRQLWSYAPSKDKGFDIRSLYTKARDTQMMAHQLGEPFSYEWTQRRIAEEHDRLMVIQRRRALLRDYELAVDRYGADSIEAFSFKVDIADFFPQSKFEYNGVHVQILTNYDRIVEEGTAMRHCVAGYATRCMNMNYLVAHIVDEAGVDSTLGLHVRHNVDGSFTFQFSQHYRVCNHHVTNPVAATAASELIADLNEFGLTKDNFNLFLRTKHEESKSVVESLPQ